MVLSIHQPTLLPPREANGKTRHYFRSNFISTKAATARQKAHWILFINKVIHKLWDLSSVCERNAGGGCWVKDGGERQHLSLYPLTPGWVAGGCREGFAPVEVGGRRDWALALGEAEPVSGAVWSGLIKAGTASGSVAFSRGSGLGENTQSHSSLGGFPVWLGHWGIHCCSGIPTSCQGALVYVSTLVEVIFSNTWTVLG